MSTTGRPEPPVSSTCTLVRDSRPLWAFTSAIVFPLLSCSCLRVQDDLGPAVLAVVEPPVALGRLVQAELLGDDHAGVHLVLVDQVAQLPVVLLDVGLAGAHRLALEEEGAEVEGELALLGQVVLRGRVFGYEYPDHAE